MIPPESEDEWQARFRELRDEEAAGAPAYDRIRDGAFARCFVAQSTADGLWPRMRWAMAVALVLALAGGWWMAGRRDDDAPRPAVSDATLLEWIAEATPAEPEWNAATDALLADADRAALSPDVEQLTREIDALLQP